MTNSLLWYVARSSGLVGWSTLAASMIWGLLMTTRLLGPRPRAAWMLDLHRYLGALAVTFTVVHVVGITLDSYARIGLVSALVPFADHRATVPLGLGVVSLYLLVAVELTSLVRRHLRRTVWRRIHQLSFALFVSSTLHALTEGTDSRNLLVLITGGLGVFTALLLIVFRVGDVLDPEPTRNDLRAGATSRTR